MWNKIIVVFMLHLNFIANINNPAVRWGGERRKGRQSKVNVGTWTPSSEGESWEIHVKAKANKPMTERNARNLDKINIYEFTSLSEPSHIANICTPRETRYSWYISQVIAVESLKWNIFMSSIWHRHVGYLIWLSSSHLSTSFSLLLCAFFFDSVRHFAAVNNSKSRPGEWIY